MERSLVTIFWAVLGASVGSFLNIVADRLPRDQSILSPPSLCENCGRRLRPWEMAPVLSFLAGRGRCQECNAPIGARVLLVELGAGLLFALAAWRIAPSDSKSWVTLLLTSAYLAILLVVTITDLEHKLILNRVIYPAIGLGIIGALRIGWPDLVSYLGGGLLGAGVIMAIIALVPEGMGWGDARLAGFVGLVTGLQGIQFALFVGFVSGGIVAAVLLLGRRRQRGDTIPLGPFLALGGGAVLLYGEEMIDVFHALSALF